MKESNAAYSAMQSLNIPVHCKTTQKAGKKRIDCFCYPPLSGGRARSKRKGGKGR